MKVSSVSKRYAKAFYQFSDEKGILPQILGTFSELRHVLAKPHIKRFFSNQQNQQSKLYTLLESALKENGEILRFFRYLLSKGRLFLIGEIVDSFVELADEKKGIVRIQVQSARLLSETLKSELKKVYETKTKKICEIETSVNPRLIGGIRLQIEDKVWDYSIASKLRRLGRK